MAVYTPLTDGELQLLLAQYDLGELISCEGVAEGVENSNFVVTTARGRFVLTIFEKRVVEADLPFFMAMMARLAERGFPAPEPMRMNGGGFIARVKDKPAVVVSFLDGVSPRTPTRAQCAEMGRALARMHVALQGLPHIRANALSVDGWEGLIKPRLDQAESLRARLSAELTSDMAETRAKWPVGLPRGAIHADLFPDNALFTDARLTGVIDFYFACTDFLAYDLAVCLNAWCFEGTLDYNVAKSGDMIAAYDAVRPLTRAERDALPTLVRGAALRFLATRLADWDETPAGALVKPKDPLEYADKLSFHRCARPVDYGS